MSRGYLLPQGCKDLIDALKLKSVPQSQEDSPDVNLLKLPAGVLSLMSKLSPKELERLFDALKKFKPQVIKFEPELPSPKSASALPPVAGQIVIPAETSVSRLATLLGQKLSQIVADVLELGFFVTASDPLSFEIISNVARKHGFLAIRAAA